MNVTDAEKLILLMLSDLHDEAGLEKIDTKFLRSAISSNNTWAINWEMPELGMDLSDTPQVAIDVVDYMHMWGTLEDVWSVLPEDQKEYISGRVSLGKHVRFPGFHSSAESELYSIAKLFVDDMGRFERYKGRDLNSHVPMRDKYKKMYEVFEKVVGVDNFSRALTVEEFIEVFSAGGI